MAPNGGAVLIIIGLSLTFVNALDWNSDIVATEELKKMGENDALHQYYGQFVKDERVFPSRETMAKKIGEFSEVNASSLVNHDYNAMTLFLKQFALEYPSITKLYSAGKSVQGRDLWVFIISDNPNEHELLEPEVKIVGNMHGNEVVGREAVLYLIDIFCKNYGKNEWITKYVNETRLHLMPSMNPDGYERGFPGDRMGYSGRENANGIDLNRNFPAQYPEHIEQSGGLSPEQETKVMMKWLLEYPFVLSANLHGGSLVANYPWDDSVTGRDGEYTQTKDDILFVGLAYRYSRAHSNMWKTGRRCGLQIDGDTFLNGITNGAGWYHLAGGMQDWQYLHANTLEITIEMGCFKFPTNDMLPKLWSEHEYSLLSFLEMAHVGVKGIVKDSNGKPVANATISIESGKDMKTTADGEFWRLLAPGEHELVVSALGLETETFRVTVNGTNTVHNVTLSACGKDDKTKSTIRRGRGSTRIVVVGVSDVAGQILRKMAEDSCSDESYLDDQLSVIIVPIYNENLTTLVHDEYPAAIIAVSEGLLESVVFSAGDKIPRIFHKEALERSLNTALGTGKNCDLNNHPLRNTSVAKMMDDFHLSNAFQIGVGLGCEHTENGKEAAAVAGILKMLRKILTKDAVDEFSVKPSADPSDHFTPEDVKLVTSASMPVMEEKGCTRTVPHPILKMTEMGTGQPPYTLVMAIEKKTETLVYQMATTWCDSTDPEVRKILERSTIVFLPEIPHTQLNCHDYGSIAPFENLLEDVGKYIPQVDYVVMFGSGGLKVRYINSTFGISERLAEIYRNQHELMGTYSDVCTGGIPQERDVIKRFEWDDKQWYKPDALLVQTSCCYENGGAGQLWGENRRAIRDMMLLRTKGVLVRATSSEAVSVKYSNGTRRSLVKGSVFIPLNNGHHKLELMRGEKLWTQFTVDISDASPFHERWIGSGSGTSFVVITVVALLMCMGCCFIIRGRFVGFFNRKGLFPRSKDGFERIPLYMSEDEDEDDVIDMNKLGARSAL